MSRPDDPLEKTDHEKRRDDFNTTADRRLAEIVAHGKTIPWSEIRAYVQRRLADKMAVRPASRPFAR